MALKTHDGTGMVAHRTDRNQVLGIESRRGGGGGAKPQNPMIYFPL